jgi:hypothetical protein
MKRLIPALLSASLVALLAIRPAASQDKDGYVPMFNGKDLTGWINVNCDPSTFYVKDNMIITTGKPTGFLRTAKQYENFVMEFEWMHQEKVKLANSGLFVWGDPIPAVGTGYTRGIEVQVLCNATVDGSYTSHGDIFSIWGADCTPDRPHPNPKNKRCLPSEYRCKGGGEWNHYKVTGNNGAIKLEVNGKEVSGVSKCTPCKGYLALESEGAECWFKNLKIKELPSTNPSPKDVANVDVGFKTLYYGINLKGWKVEPGSEGHWTAKDTILAYDGKSDAKIKDLWTDKSYRDFEFIVDYKFKGKGVKKSYPNVLPSGDDEIDPVTKKVKEIEVMDAGNSGVYLRGSDKAQINISFYPVGTGEIVGYRTDKTLPAAIRAAVTPKMRADEAAGKWNRIHATMKGDRVTVVLNNTLVIDNAQLPGIPAEGPIGLQHHGDPIEFANLFVRELK